MENPFTKPRMSFQDHEKVFNYLIYALNISFFRYLKMNIIPLWPFDAILNELVSFVLLLF